MSRALKERMTAELIHELDGVTGCVVIGYEKLGTEEAQALRARLRQDGIKMRIVKNSLAFLALDKVGLGSAKEFISGPSALLFSRTEGGVPTLSKVITEWTKKSQTVKVRGGMLDGRSIRPEDVKKLAAIPSRPVLLSMTLQLTKAPMTKLAVLTKAPIEKTARLLKALSDKNAAAAPVAAAEAAPVAAEGSAS
ncbi:MAG: 50S ribosomal protein L10 [Planctomycetes bacterium]|nr:50S ribosomal protein L10 [Planctomycetota bacterium]